MKGFTLIELSIVLVIISLVVGGIVGGKSLIKSAEVNQFAQDLKTYSSSALTFTDQYDYYPGDLPNAQEYWPQCIDEVGVTCNGNGDSKIGLTDEKFRVMEHLSLSGIIDHQYKYEDGADKSQYYYKAKIKEWNVSGTLEYTQNVYTKAGHIMYLPSLSNSIDVSSIVKVDKKIDDGKASNGSFMSLFYNLYIIFGYTSCVDTGIALGNLSTVTTSNYVLSERNASCVMVYRL